MYFCKSDSLLDNYIHKYEIHKYEIHKYEIHKYETYKFNYEKDKVKPKPKIILKYYNKNDILASRKWYGLNINNITIKN